MMIIDACGGRSARIIGSQSVTLYKDKRKRRIFKTCRMVDGQAIARMWVREYCALPEIASSWRATFKNNRLLKLGLRKAVVQK